MQKKGLIWDRFLCDLAIVLGLLILSVCLCVGTIHLFGFLPYAIGTILALCIWEPSRAKFPFALYAIATLIFFVGLMAVAIACFVINAILRKGVKGYAVRYCSTG